MDFLFLLAAIEILMLLVAYTYLAGPSMVYPHFYRRIRSKRYDRSYHPNVSIFIPCQGTGNRLEHHVQTFLERRFPRARLFFIVESCEDPAHAVIARLIRETPNACLVEAGSTGTCGQKNHNLLKGIEAAGRRDDVYVFFDSISTFTFEQLSDLLAPLSDPEVAVATGFRWDILREGTLGQRVHAFMIAVQWALLNSPFNCGVWGGCAAIRRETFEEMDVAGYWAKTVVDDTSLVNLLHQQRRRSVFVPTCVKELDGPAMTVKESILWFRRQVLYIKFYRRFDWSCALALLVWCGLICLAFPVLLLGAVTWPSPALTALVGVTGVGMLLQMLCALCMKRPSEDNHSAIAWFLLSPLFMVCTSGAFVIGLFTRALRWRHVVYHLDHQGFVTGVERPAGATDLRPPAATGTVPSSRTVETV